MATKPSPYWMEVFTDDHKSLGCFPLSWRDGAELSTAFERYGLEADGTWQMEQDMMRRQDWYVEEDTEEVWHAYGNFVDQSPDVEELIDLYINADRANALLHPNKYIRERAKAYDDIS